MVEQGILFGIIFGVVAFCITFFTIYKSYTSDYEVTPYNYKSNGILSSTGAPRDMLIDQHVIRTPIAHRQDMGGVHGGAPHGGPHGGPGGHGSGGPRGGRR